VTVPRRSVRRGGAGLLIALASVAAGAARAAEGPDASSRVRAEISRLRKSLEEKPLAGTEYEGVHAACERGLATAADALDAGRLYSSLESLGRASDLIHGARFALDKTAAAFESEWAEANRTLVVGRQGRDDGRWARSRVAVRALAEAAAGKVGPLLEGARGFAVAKGPKDGLFYLGQARGQAEFAALCASLTFPHEVERVPLPSMLPELHRLQQAATAAFRPPRSIELHDRFIALNSSLKAALELDATQSYAGSAYLYLEAVRHHAMLDAPVLDEAAQAQVREDLAAARARIGTGKRDESLAQLFLERAAGQLAHPDGSAPSADEWRSARVILDRVLPAYSAARLPVDAAREASGRTIRMTLVRWPYT
jgi:hypothetical protein